MKNVVIIAALFAATVNVSANTKEIKDSLKGIEEFQNDNRGKGKNKGNCWLLVQYTDEDGANYQSKDYYWETKSLEECFSKISEKTKSYEENRAISVLSFKSEYK